MNQRSLQGWLLYIQTLHVKEMDLSLERVALVAQRLNLSTTQSCPVITVAGTNGKGSCVAGLEAIYLAAGYRVGAFTSPYLYRHNEQVRIQGKEAEDDLFCRAFEKVEMARGEIGLTIFEFNTLATFIMFKEAKLDVWILEVGLGGRWDAVNVMDADVAIVASIGIDHTDWLGHTREEIAFEKAGIFRSKAPAVCGDLDPPHTLIDVAKKIAAPLFCQNKQFGFEKKQSSWDWWSEKNDLTDLPLSTLALQNMATVLMAVELLQQKLPVTRPAIVKALAKVTLPGRIQVIPGDVEQIFDVSHNPAAAEFLSTWLREHAISGKTRAVFSMLADKDIVATLDVIKKYFAEWYIAALPVKRGAALEVLTQSFKKAEIHQVKTFSTIKDAYHAALKNSISGDRVVVFGSFHTVAEIK